MSQEPIICRYIFTAAEHRRAMRGFWFALKWPILLLIVIVVGSMMSPFLAPPNRTQSSEKFQESVWNPILNFGVPGMIVAGVIAYAAFRPGRIFRKGPFFEKEFDYALDWNLLRVKNPLAQVELKWEAISRAAENKYGFMLYPLNGRAFHWLPKSGFASSSEIIRLRELIRARVKKTRLLRS